MLILLIVLSVIGCGTIQNHQIHNASTSELQLRRYQAMYRIGTGPETDWRGVSSSRDDDINEKERIERELARRGAIDYRSAPHVTYW
jgi:hypothetical protein